MTTAVVPFLLVYGVSYFFTEFGPNMTTFVMPSELYPVTMRATGHGISGESAGIMQIVERTNYKAAVTVLEHQFPGLGTKAVTPARPDAGGQADEVQRLHLVASG